MKAISSGVALKESDALSEYCYEIITSFIVTFELQTELIMKQVHTGLAFVHSERFLCTVRPSFFSLLLFPSGRRMLPYIRHLQTILRAFRSEMESTRTHMLRDLV